MLHKQNIYKIGMICVTAVALLLCVFVYNKSHINKPVFSVDGGVYNEAFTLSITSDKGCRIYYTTDGSDPVVGADNTYLYEGVITIDDKTQYPNQYCSREDLTVDTYHIPERNIEKATIIRALAVNSQGKQSEIVDNTYFVLSDMWDDSYPTDLPIVSISCDPALLFDDDDGALVLGKRYRDWVAEDPSRAEGKTDQGLEANYYRDWSVPVTLTYIEDGKQKYSQVVDIEKQGEFSSRGAQKPMDVKANINYGSKTYGYDILGNGRHPKDFLLKRYYRETYDCFLTDNAVANESAHALPRAHKPVMLFIEGECWGCYVIMEKYSLSYFEDNLGLSENNLYVLKDGKTYIGSEDGLADMNDIENFVMTNDMSLSENYQKICDRIDMASYIDYYCRTAYMDNDDEEEYRNTYKWRSITADSGSDLANGKWHWALIDLNMALEDPSRNHMTEAKEGDTPLFQQKIFWSLYQNKEFRQAYCKKMHELIDNDYNPETIVPAYEAVCERMSKPTVYTIDRFIQPSYNHWDYEGDWIKVIEFWYQRPGYIDAWMQVLFPDEWGRS